ncbi:MAG: hypothetical protein CMN44_00240 [SAR116 cluster bacterium]|nr:hypothetical protein [SAR116 cluster bacterium]RPH12296.1 MAG: hypothetical protein CBC14_000235 [Alphaproteobacteria bacterium TMED54]
MDKINKSEINSIFKLVSRNFSNLGKIEKLEKFKSNGHNSIIFSFKVGNKKFLVKFLKNPNLIYGHNKGSERIKIITNIISNLSKSFPLEKFVSNKFGKLTIKFNDGIIRVTEFIENRNIKGNNFLKSVNFLNKIHNQFWYELKTKEKENLNSLIVPYELDYTFRKIKLIEEFLISQANIDQGLINKNHIKIILDNFELLNYWAKKLNLLKDKKFFHLKSFTHNDYHPSNIIFDKDKRLYLLDFDNIQYSKIFRCLFFFLLRHSTNQKKLSESLLKQNYKILESNYFTKIPNFENAIFYLMYIEIEKIFKILCRVSEKKGLTFFINNIISVHLPNVLFLIKLNQKQA